MRKIFSVAVGVLLLMVACVDNRNPDNDNPIPSRQLQSLDHAIAQSSHYAAAARRPIDSLVRVVSRTTDNARASLILSDIAHEMSVLNSDSAIIYADEAMRRAVLSANDSVEVAARLARCNALASAGIFNLAEKEFETLEHTPMSWRQRAILWQVARQMYAYAQMYCESNFEVSQQFRQKSMAYDDSLMTVLPEGHDFRRFLAAERDMGRGNYKSAKAALDSLLPKFKPGDHLYGMVTFQLSLYYRHIGDEARYGEYMAKAAESDIRGGVREGLALFSLANWLYDKGRVNDAFRYVNFAMREAMEGQARMRAVNIATMLPMIDETYQRGTREAHNRLMVFFIIGVIALGVAVFFLILLVIQRRRSRQTRARIAALSKAREAQLANFLALCSTYYHKLHSLQMLVRRKISSGQTDELLKLLKSGRYAESESDEIFSNFDRSFVEIYPDFIEQINRLLREEERFSVPADGTLPPELRIYALVTMGITDSPRIAQILNYSVNTVYAYRNKMRNKAIDRENFEKTVASMEPFEHDL